MRCDFNMKDCLYSNWNHFYKTVAISGQFCPVLKSFLSVSSQFCPVQTTPIQFSSMEFRSIDWVLKHLKSIDLAPIQLQYSKSQYSSCIFIQVQHTRTIIPIQVTVQYCNSIVSRLFPLKPIQFSPIYSNYSKFTSTCGRKWKSPRAAASSTRRIRTWLEYSS